MAAEPKGVYFTPKDYAHPVRRVGAMLIDLALLVSLLSLIGSLTAVLLVPANVRNQPRTPETQREINKYMKPVQVPVVLGWLAICVAYHVPVRRTRGGTLGYRLMGIRLLDETGQTPSMRALFKRFLLAIPCTVFLGLTYVSCFTSPKRQATHDKWSGTWAIRKHATPAGPAVVSYHTSFLGTIPTTYIDVEPLPAETPSETSSSSAECSPAAASGCP